MPRRIRLELHLTEDELHGRYRRATDPVERSHWHFLWLLGGMTNGNRVARRGMKPFLKQVRHDSQSQVKMGTGTLHCSLKRLLAERLIEEAGERPDSAPDGERRR
jgi:hypothetical protein